jgi:uncharacterized protein
VDYCDQLCAILNADCEIVRISAYLHDISAVIDFKTLPTHNTNSSEIAESFLAKNNYPRNKIEKVVQCIKSHISPLTIQKGNIEDVVLSNADAMSQIVNPAYWLYFAYKLRGLNFNDGQSWYLNKINTNWNLLIDPAKKLIEDKYWNVKKALENKNGGY